MKLNRTIFKKCYCWLGVWKHSIWIHCRQTHKQSSISKQKAPWTGVYHYISLNSTDSPQPKSSEKHYLWSDISVRLISQLAICCPEVKMILGNQKCFPTLSHLIGFSLPIAKNWHLPPVEVKLVILSDRTTLNNRHKPNWSVQRFELLHEHKNHVKVSRNTKINWHPIVFTY